MTRSLFHTFFLTHTHTRSQWNNSPAVWWGIQGNIGQFLLNSVITYQKDKICIKPRLQKQPPKNAVIHIIQKDTDEDHLELREKVAINK